MTEPNLDAPDRSMPSALLERARQLAGQEVLATIRGKVWIDADVYLVGSNGAYDVLLTEDPRHPRLVAIEPAPVEIVPGQLYQDQQGRLLEGREGGMVAPYGHAFPAELEFYPIPGTIRPVKVVDA